MILDVFNKNFERIDTIHKFSYAQYNKSLNSSGSFELRLGLVDEAKLLISEAQFILFELTVCGKITYVPPEIDEKTGKQELIVKGNLVNCLIEQRCIPKTINYSDSTVNVVYSLVNNNCVNPTDPNRRMPLRLNNTRPSDSSSITSQVTGGSVKEAVEKLLDVQNMGYEIIPVLTSTSLSGFEFKVLKGADRSIGNAQGNTPVVFSQDLKNIYTSSYTRNSNDARTTAYVAGEGEGTDRKVIISGGASISGLDRVELYVDARDLQSTDENGNTLTTTQYTEALQNRGMEQLAEHQIAESYESTVNPISSTSKYGQDYTLGDWVTVRDTRIGISIVAQVTSISSTSQGEQDILDVTFGHYKMGTIKRLKRKGVL